MTPQSYSEKYGHQFDIDHNIQQNAMIMLRVAELLEQSQEAHEIMHLLATQEILASVIREQRQATRSEKKHSPMRLIDSVSRIS